MLNWLVASDSELELAVFSTLHESKSCKVVSVLTTLNSGNLPFLLNEVSVIDGMALIRFLVNSKPNKALTGEYFELESLVQNDLEQFLEMCKRLDISDLDSYQSRRLLFSNLIQYWAKLLETNSIGVVFFSSCPHEVSDYALYLVCRAFGIRILFFQDLHLFGRRILTSTIQSPWNSVIRTRPHGLNKTELLTFIDRHTLQYSPPWQIPFVSDKREIPTVPLRKLVRFSIITLLRAGMILNLGLMLSIPIRSLKRRIIVNLASQIASLKAGIFFISNSVQFTTLKHQSREAKMDVPTSEYVLYCMNLDPEMMVNPLGGEFASQLQAISKLRALLPKEILLLVREHPAQYSLDSGLGRLGRESNFHSSMSETIGIELVNSEAELGALVMNSEAVFTLNGTVGWQSALSGKKVGLLGNSWYEGAPNTQRFYPATTTAEFLDWLSRDSFAEKDDFVNFLDSLFSNSVKYSGSLELATALGSEWNSHDDSKVFEELIREYLESSTNINEL